MDISRPAPQKNLSFLFWLLLSWGIYALLGMLAPINPEALVKYDLSHGELRLLQLSLQVPILILWSALFYGTFRFWEYAKKIAGTPESRGFQLIVFGLFVLMAGLIIPSYVGLLNSYNPDNTTIEKAVTLFNQYAGMTTSFLAFIFFLLGAKKLNTLVTEQLPRARVFFTTLVLVLLFGGIYAYAVFHNADRLVPTTPGVERPAYYLPSDTWIIFSVIIPYLIVWVIGLLSAFSIGHFTRYVNGIVYKNAFRAIGRGIISLVVVSMGLQLLAQSGSLFVDTGLLAILIVVYILLAAIAVGYLFIAQGARELGKLETI